MLSKHVTLRNVCYAQAACRSLLVGHAMIGSWNTKLVAWEQGTSCGQFGHAHCWFVWRQGRNKRFCLC